MVIHFGVNIHLSPSAFLNVFFYLFAAQPLTWNYDLNKLDTIIGKNEEIEFWTPSANPYYTIPTGKNSAYGDQAYVLLKSLVQCKGKV